VQEIGLSSNHHSFGGHSPSFALPEDWSNQRFYELANQFAVARESERRRMVEAGGVEIKLATDST
jgi:hypothetical protein